MNVEVNDKFVMGDSSQTQKYKPIDVKTCTLDKNARDLLIECMRQRVIQEDDIEIRYQVWGSKQFNQKKDPIAIMTGGRLAAICNILLNWGDSAKEMLAWHPDNHDRCVFIFVPMEIFDAARHLIQNAELPNLFSNGLCVVGWEFETNTTVRYGFGAMRRAVLTFFRGPKIKSVYSGFWLLDDDTMIVPRTFDEAESFAKKGACIIGFSKGSTQRVKQEEASGKYKDHQTALQSYPPSQSKETMDTVVLQQVVKYCGIHEENFPSFHQGFICSGEDVSFQRFLQKIQAIPVVLVSGSIDKIELSNDYIIAEHEFQCVVLKDELGRLNARQNKRRKVIAFSELEHLNQLQCTVTVGKTGRKTMPFGQFIWYIHSLCEKQGNKLNRSPEDILFLVIELLFCWNDGLKRSIPPPNTSVARVFTSKDALIKARQTDMLGLIASQLEKHGFTRSIIELIFSFL